MRTRHLLKSLGLAAATLALGQMALANQPGAQASAAAFVSEAGDALVAAPLEFQEDRIEVYCTRTASRHVGYEIRPLKTAFNSRRVPPAQGLRVRIWNTSPAFASLRTQPYTDRRYDSGTRSEGFDMLPGNRHQTRYFIVDARHGEVSENTFVFEIRQGESVVERGALRASFTIVPGETQHRMDDPFYCPLPDWPRPFPVP